MRILFCSPYGKSNDIALGGIGIWGKNILSYTSKIDSNINLIPVSFDRRTYIGSETGTLKRLLSGLQEIGRSLREAIRTLHTEKIDVVHISTSASISLLKDLFLIKAAHNSNVKAVVHFHFGRIPVLSEQKNWEWKLLLKVVKSADTVIAMDMASYHVLECAGLENIRYCPNPLSLESQIQIEKLQGAIERVPLKILFVGHVLPTKGVFELVDACKCIKNIELHIVGRAEPSIEMEMKRRAAVKDCGTWIKFRGELSHDKVIEEMLSANVFVLPTYTEGFPNVILESMACACPIVTTPVGAIPEMLDVKSDAPCGLVVPVGDTDALRNAIVTMIENSQEANKFALRAQMKVQKEYRVDQVWKQLEKIWLSVISINN